MALIGAAVALATVWAGWSWFIGQHPAKEAVSATRSTIADNSIAVLPFADLSEARDQQYFADGIAEEVLDRLASVPGMRVVGRASRFSFGTKQQTPRASARHCT